MFNWLSNYDYDFALAAIPVQLILILFYRVRRNLPIRQSSGFFYVMVSGLIMIVSDIISCELIAIHQSVSLFSLYLSNIIYFLSLIYCFWSVFDYTAETCREYRILDRRSRILAAIPFIVVAFLIVTTPWFHGIFKITENGYENGLLYNSIYVVIYFYLFASMTCVFTCFNKLALRVKSGLFIALSVLIVGLILRKVLYGNYLVVCYFITLADLIIYITTENPDLYRDQRIKLFNRNAFDLIGIDLLYRNEPFHCIAARVHNYETALTLYGNSQVIEALEDIGRQMIRNFPGYYVFYFGSGNFILMKKGKISEETAYSVSEWEKHFDTMHTVNIHEVSLAMSFMILPFAMMRENVYQIEDFIEFIFSRAYQENQKGNYIVNEALLSELLREKEVETALTNALEQNRMEAYFQPIYSTEKKKIVGAEALARLIDPEIGYIPPLEFIEIAERNGDIMELGRQIFEKVCDFARKERLMERGIEFINVNLSPAQCLNSLLVNELSAIASKYDISMNMIDFEITESAAADFRSIQRQMFLLQKEGAELSLDDFGAGTSNLTRLMNLPIHVVKIDMDVAMSYFNNEAPFLPDLVKMFQHANMKIVVEGVETEHMKDALSEMGCDYLQGFYFSKALPPEEFIEYLDNLKE